MGRPPTYPWAAHLASGERWHADFPYVATPGQSTAWDKARAAAVQWARRNHCAVRTKVQPLMEHREEFDTPVVVAFRLHVQLRPTDDDGWDPLFGHEAVDPDARGAGPIVSCPHCGGEVARIRNTCLHCEGVTCGACGQLIYRADSLPVPAPAPS